MVQGRLGKRESYGGIWREVDGVNKEIDDREKKGYEGLARMIKTHKGSQEIELERIRQTRFEIKKNGSLR